VKLPWTIYSFNSTEYCKQKFPNCSLDKLKRDLTCKCGEERRKLQKSWSDIVQPLMQSLRYWLLSLRYCYYTLPPAALLLLWWYIVTACMHIPFIKRLYVYIPCMHHACAMHTASMNSAQTMHVPSTDHVYTMHVTCIVQAWISRTSYIYNLHVTCI